MRGKENLIGWIVPDSTDYEEDVTMLCDNRDTITDSFHINKDSQKGVFLESTIYPVLMLVMNEARYVFHCFFFFFKLPPLFIFFFLKNAIRRELNSNPNCQALVCFTLICAETGLSILSCCKKVHFLVFLAIRLHKKHSQKSWSQDKANLGRLSQLFQKPQSNVRVWGEAWLLQSWSSPCNVLRAILVSGHAALTKEEPECFNFTLQLLTPTNHHHYGKWNWRLPKL